MKHREVVDEPLFLVLGARGGVNQRDLDTQGAKLARRRRASAAAPQDGVAGAGRREPRATGGGGRMPTAQQERSDRATGAVGKE